MQATNFTNLRDNLKEYCDIAVNNGEAVIVTRKQNKNVVLISLEQYNEYEKFQKNQAYIDKINRSFAQLYAGNGEVHDLVEV